MSNRPEDVEKAILHYPSYLQEEVRRLRKSTEDNATASPIGPSRQLVLPPDTPLEKFERAIVALKQLIGNDNVIVNDQPLDDGWYGHATKTHDSFYIFEQDEFVASAVVRPKDVSDVQGIVRWANQFLIPVYPVSVGRNLGYGGASPRVRGGVVIDLGHHMNKVLEINGQNASCLVEPGVTYYSLHDAVRKSGLPLWTDTPDLPGGSVMGNALDRGMGYTPYGDHWARRCGMEIVLPNGDLVRTGMGAMSNTTTWQSNPVGFGPTFDGLFTQANNGIVTKMGFGLMPAVKTTRCYQVTFKRDEDLSAIIETLSPMMLNGLLSNVPSLRYLPHEAAWHRSRNTFFHDFDGALSDAQLDELSQKHFNGNRWFLYGCFYSNGDNCDAEAKIVKDAFEKIPGAKFDFAEDSPEGSYIRTRTKIFQGQPDFREWQWVNWLPNGAHWAFSPISSVSGAEAMKQFEVARERHRQYGFDFFSTFCVTGRFMLHIICVCYDRHNPRHRKDGLKMMRALIEDARENGWGEYRTHPVLADQVMRAYDFNDGAHRRLAETIKDALDPNSILAPGKAGVWGQRYRGRGWELYGEETKSVPWEREGAKGHL